MSDWTVLITGVTGNQGGATARALAGQGLRLRGMTRRPHGDAARALKDLGVEIIEGDLDDEDSLKRAVEGAWGVYAVQNTWEGGVEKEETQGHRLARLAHAAGVERYVYASVGSAHRTGRRSWAGGARRTGTAARPRTRGPWRWPRAWPTGRARHRTGPGRSSTPRRRCRSSNHPRCLATGPRRRSARARSRTGSSGCGTSRRRRRWCASRRAGGS